MPLLVAIGVDIGGVLLGDAASAIVRLEVEEVDRRSSVLGQAMFIAIAVISPRGLLSVSYVEDMQDRSPAAENCLYGFEL